MRNLLRKLLNEQAEQSRKEIFMKYLLKQMRSKPFHYTDGQAPNRMIDRAVVGTGYKLPDSARVSLYVVLRNYNPDKPIYFYRFRVLMNHIWVERDRFGYITDREIKLQWFEQYCYTQYTKEEMEYYYKWLKDLQRDARVILQVQYAPHGDNNPDYAIDEIQEIDYLEVEEYL